jgi:hypothetical protein
MTCHALSLQDLQCLVFSTSQSWTAMVSLLVPDLKFKIAGEMASLSNLEHNILSWVDTRNPVVE